METTSQQLMVLRAPKKQWQHDNYALKVLSLATWRDRLGGASVQAKMSWRSHINKYDDMALVFIFFLLVAASVCSRSLFSIF